MRSARSPRHHYWRRHGTLIIVLLVIWLLVPNVGGIFFVETLNRWQFGGFPLGFWIAQQGAILLFLLLLLVYAVVMGRFDREYHRERKEAGEEQ